jgi:hypothetical protein
MAAPLSICIKEEQRAVAPFFMGGLKGVEIHTRICAQYGDNALLQRSVYEWTDMFKEGRPSATDTERSARQSTATSGDKHEG